MEPFFAYNSRWRMALIFMGVIGFLTLGLWMVGMFGDMVRSDDVINVRQIIAGWGDIIFFGVCGVFILKRMLYKEPHLRIDESGIYLSYWSDQIIP